MISSFIIAYAFLCLGGVIGWLLRNAIVQEQVEYVEPTEHSTFWLEKRS